MAIGANSYGSAAGVAALAPLYATGTGQTFTTQTRPTLVQVEAFVDQVSGMVNSILAREGFEVPVAQADAKLSLDGFVNLEVAAYVEYANGAGPFVSDGTQLRASTPAMRVLRDAQEFIEANAVGLEALGVTRTRLLTQGLAADEVEPLWDWEWNG